MAALSRLKSLWRNLVHRDRVDRDLHEEIATVFELLVDERIRAGVPPAEARRAATFALGRIEGVKDRVRDARAGVAFDTFSRDVRYAVRLLRRNPCFAAVAALSLAVGIGAKHLECRRNRFLPNASHADRRGT